MIKVELENNRGDIFVGNDMAYFLSHVHGEIEHIKQNKSNKELSEFVASDFVKSFKEWLEDNDIMTPPLFKRAVGLDEPTTAWMRSTTKASFREFYLNWLQCEVEKMTDKSPRD